MLSLSRSNFLFIAPWRAYIIIYGPFLSTAMTFEAKLHWVYFFFFLRKEESLTERQKPEFFCCFILLQTGYFYRESHEDLGTQCWTRIWLQWLAWKPEVNPHKASISTDFAAIGNIACPNQVGPIITSTKTEVW